MEIGPENVAEPNAKLAPPTDIVAISGTKEVKGQAEATNDRNRQLRAYVYAKDPTSEPNQIPLGQNTAGKGNGKFTVKLQEPLASGQVLYIVLKQENKKGSEWIPDGVESDPISVSVPLSLADRYDAGLIVPEDTFFHEDQATRSDEEVSEIFEAFKRDNPAIAGFMKAIKLYNVSQQQLSAEVIYSDNSVGARKTINIEPIKERSAKPVVDEPFLVTGNTVAGTLEPQDGQQVKPGTKVRGVTQIDSQDRKNFEPEASCNVVKSQATYADVDAESGRFSVDVGYDTLRLNWPGSSEGDIGIKVKEPKKLPTCIVTVPEGPTSTRSVAAGAFMKMVAPFVLARTEPSGSTGQSIRKQIRLDSIQPSGASHAVLQLQKRAFSLYATRVTRQRAIRRDYPVTRYNNRQRIMSHSCAHRPIRARPPHGLRNFLIS